MNLLLFARVAWYFLCEPRRLNMDVWLGADEKSPCGTVGCIAGTAIMLHNNNRAAVLKEEHVYKIDCAMNAGRTDSVTYEDIANAACRALGIDPKGSDRLFQVHSWPQPFRANYTYARTPLKRTLVTLHRMAAFVTSNGRV